MNNRRFVLRGVGGVLLAPLARLSVPFVGAGSSIAGGAVIGGSLAVTVLTVSTPAKADPLTAGFIIFVGLHALFRKYGLEERHLAVVRNARDVRGRQDGSFHDQFNDPVVAGVSQAWRFVNGRLVGVRGNAFAVDNTDDEKGAEYNRVELAALSHPKTLSDYGSLMPISAREAPNRNLIEGYREAVAAANRARSSVSRTPSPEYFRTFTNFDSPGSNDHVGVFGATRDRVTQVVWIDGNDARKLM